MTDAELQEHHEFYGWFHDNFKTRFSLSGIGDSRSGGRYLSGGRIGFCHPDSNLRDLHKSPSGCWLYFKSQNDTWTRYTPNFRWFYRRKRDSIKFRLEAWNQSRAQISTLAGINGDIRQVALLTLILQYRPGQTQLTLE